MLTGQDEISTLTTTAEIRWILTRHLELKLFEPRGVCPIIEQCLQGLGELQHC